MAAQGGGEPHRRPGAPHHGKLPAPGLLRPWPSSAGVGQKGPGVELQGEKEPKEAVVARFGEAWDALLQAFRGVREADLSALVRVGNQGVEAPRAHVLHHLVEHAQHHAGQVIYASKLL